MQTEQSLPHYTLRHSTRARRWRLQITRKRGLELVVPRRFDSTQIPIILHEHRHWIARHWQRLKQFPLTDANELPTAIQLAAINETWQIEYLATHSETLNVLAPNAGQLILQGNIQDKQQSKTLLIKWLHTHARYHLLPWLAQLSASVGFNYTEAKIRSAGTRWGSCSAKRCITLNYQLLFLPTRLVQHVMLHELCHLQHLNHSRQFWQLLATLDPEHQISHRQLKHAQQYIPTWSLV